MAIKIVSPVEKLVVNGTGGTLLDVQGSAGQLFSVTDSLTGDLFAVSDISGIPILNVNSSGAVDIDGTLAVDGKLGVGLTPTTVNLEVKSIQDSSFDEGIGIVRSNTSQTGYINMVGGAMNINAPNAIPIKFRDGGNTNLTIGGDGHATFSGNVILNSRLTFDYGGDHYLEAGTDALSYKSSGGGAVMTLNASTSNATFASNIYAGGDLTVAGGDVYITKQNDAPTLTLLHDGTNPSANDMLFVMQFQSDYEGSHQNWGKIICDTNNSAVRTNLDFHVKSAGGGEQIGFRIEGQPSETPKGYFYNDVDVDGDLTATNLSGTNTGDQTLPTLSSLGGAAASTAALKTFDSTANLANPSASNGTWTAATTTDWGTPRIGSSVARFNDGAGSIDFAVPTGIKTAYISQLTWSSGGYMDVYGVQTDGDEVFLRRINTENNVETTNHSNPNQHDGSTIAFAGHVGDFPTIRLHNKSGRFHLTGLGWSKSELGASDGTGLVHPNQLSIALPYSSLSGTPTLGTAAATASTAYATSAQGTLATNALSRSGGTMTGALVGTTATFIANAAAGTNALNILGVTNGLGAGITFSDNGTPAASASGQNGYITYYHGDGSSYGSGNTLILSSSESSMTILADGKLMYKEGIYSKPSSGTGAGTRKDSNWDTAYGWGDHGLSAQDKTDIDNLSGTNTGDQTLPTASSLGAVTLTGTQTISGNKTFSGSQNHYKGHLYYDSYDSAGNHYFHFNDGASVGGTTVNWRQYYGTQLKTHTWTSDSSGNMVFTFQGDIDANGGDITGDNFSGSSSGTNTGDQTFATLGAGTRSNYTLTFRAPTSSYAGFQFLDTSGAGAGYLLIRGTSDTGAYTAEGISLIADAGWLTLAQRTTSDKGIRFMTGATATTRMTIANNGDVDIVGDLTADNLSGANTGDQTLPTLSSLGAAPLASPALTGTPTAPTAGATVNTTQLATTAFVQTAVSNLVDSSPGTLNTLNELAAALGDDASFSTTVTTSIATKLPLAGGTLTGSLILPYLSVNDTAGASNGAAEEVARFVNTTSGATSSYMYIGAAAGTDWRLGKNIIGTAGNTNFGITKHSGTDVFLEIDGSGNTAIHGTIAASNLSGSNTGDQTLSSLGALPIAGGTMTGTLQADVIKDSLYLNAGNSGWKTKKWVRNVGVTGGDIDQKWVKVLDVPLTASSYTKTAVKMKIHGYDDVSSGTENIDVRYENGNTAQEYHEAYWYTTDNTPNIFSEVRSIRYESNGLTNSYQVWVKMAGDWRDTFTVEAEYWISGTDTISFPTEAGTATAPSGDSNDIALTTRSWKLSNSSVYIGSAQVATQSYVTGLGYQTSQRAISSTPTDGATTTAISSDWAFDNVKTAVPASAVFTDTVNTFDGAYGSLSGAPSLGSAALTASSSYATSAQGTTADAALPKAGGTMTGHVLFQDSVELKLGTDTDLKIYHDGTNGRIANNTGHLYIQNLSDDKDIFLRSDDGSGGVATYFYIDGSLGLVGVAKPLVVTDNATISGTLYTGDTITVGDGTDDSKIIIKNFNAVSEHIEFYNGSTRVGEIGVEDNTWLRINQETNKNIYTPRYIRADAGFFVDGTTKGINSSGNFIGGSITGASDANVSNWDTAYTYSQVGHLPLAGGTLTGDLIIESALLSNQENTDVDSAAAETVAQVAHATYTAAFFDFVIKKGTSVRAGTVYSCHDGTNVEFTETSTVDLGDTSDVSLSVDISGTNMRLRATVTSDDWIVKSLVRAI